MNDAPRAQVPQAGLSIPAVALVAVGGFTLFIGLFVDPAWTWANVLLGFYYLLGLGLGALVLIALQFVTGAGWGVATRRLPEALAALIPGASVGVLVVLVLYPSLYPWTGAHAEGAHHGSPFQDVWLSRAFFLFRAVVYAAAWVWFYRSMVGASTQQDKDGKVDHTHAIRHLSAVFLVVYGLTCWLSSVDWVMSLEPEWVSTVFGVYHFAGQFLSALAAIIVLAILLTRQGPLRGVLSHDHLHDLGKLLFAFSSFWMYIWFSQYMLIWYVNNPEETSYFIRRLHGGWSSLFYLNILLNWVIPFLVLLPVWTKRNPNVLLTVAILILIGRWIDLYQMILPPLGGGPERTFGIVEVGIAAGTLGMFLLVVIPALRRQSLVPINDPYLVESLPGAPHGEPHRTYGWNDGDRRASRIGAAGTDH